MYLDEIAAAIRSRVPADRIPEGDTAELFRLYAVLLRAKGTTVTQSDIHDAWVAWISGRDDTHTAQIPYSELAPEIQSQDEPFGAAVRAVAEQLDQSNSRPTGFEKVLFPKGNPRSETDKAQALDLYKVMVESSEKLVGRRQGVNTFFLTINGALMTASGVIVQNSHNLMLGGVAVGLLAIAGAILCSAWRSLILSFGQLNTGKFKVINSMENHLSAAIYAAEWKALAEGKNPKVYRSFTSREIWVPNALRVLYLIAVVVAFAVSFGAWHAARAATQAAGYSA